MRVLVPLGTRPEIVKLAPVVRTLAARGSDVRTVATGQHYDASLTDTFFDGLGLAPDVRWELDGDEAARVGRILENALRELDASRPDLVFLMGDTNTVPLFSLAARRHRTPVAHLEAGLRSFNETSLEEVNRKVAGALASLHFAPTELAATFLRREGVAEDRIHVVGNTSIDVLRESGVQPTPVDRRSGVVLTAHRATNVDDPDRLEALVKLILRLADEFGRVTYPVHPRSRRRLEEAGALDRLQGNGIRLLEPVPYSEMMRLVSGAQVVVTDSGGLQEEASYLGVPVVVLRHTTPRWEGVAAGTAVLTGLDVERAVDAATRFASADEQARVAAAPCPYGDGHTSERVADVLADPGTPELLAIDEPPIDRIRPWT